MGPFAAFVGAWWTWIYSWVDVAIYPVLFVKALEGVLHLSKMPVPWEGNAWFTWAMGLWVIVPFTCLNIRGTRLVGNSSVLFGAFLLLPFLLMTLWGIPAIFAHPERLTQPFTAPGEGFSKEFGAGLFIVMWNYLGWDSLSTIAGEVKEPQKNYPKALLWGVVIVTISYLLPAMVGLVVMPQLDQWTEGVWPAVAYRVTGPWLATLMAGVALVSAAGLFSATLLGASRIPFVLAEDRFLPKQISSVHPKFGTPWVAILVSAVFYTIFSASSFQDLAVIDVMVYSAAIFVEFGALAVLRFREPTMDRPYRIPGGWVGLALVCAGPLAIGAFAVVSQAQEEGRRAIVLSLYALATGPVLYAGITGWRRMRRAI
jgi:hypothetical protein